MRAWAVVEAGAPLQCIEVPDEKPTGTQVLLEVTHCGVCHSDLHFWKGSYNLGNGKVMKLAERGVVLPRAISHEVVGRVVEVGPDAEGIAVGDVRIVFPWLGCGVCKRCVAGDDNLCDKPNAIGVMQHGGFAERVMSPHPKFLVDPGAIDPALAATFACAGITVYSAIKKVMPMDPEDWIVLVGAGGLGLSAISMLKALGHQKIVVVDIDVDKRAAAKAAGATDVVDGKAADVAQAILKAAGGQVKAAIDFVNSEETAAAALDVLEKGGKLVLVGVAGGELPLSLPGLIFRPRTIQGSATGSLQDLRDVVALAQSGKLSPIPLAKMPKDDVNKAMALLQKGSVTGRIILTT